MNTRFGISMALLFWYSALIQADGFSGGIIELKQVSTTKQYTGSKIILAKEIESQILLNCKKIEANLNCMYEGKSVLRDNPRMYTVWGLVTTDGKLTSKGRKAYKKMLKDCASVDSIHLKSKVPSTEYARIAKNIQSLYENSRKECASSEKDIAKVLVKQIKDYRATCTVMSFGPNFNFNFKQVGKNKWIRTERDGVLYTLSSGPVFLGNKSQGWTGWTLVVEGFKDLNGKPWKTIYKGVQILYARGFELSSLSTCKKVIIK